GAFLFSGINGAGDRYLVDRQCTSLGIKRVFEYIPGGATAWIVRILRIVGPGQQHLAGTHEAAKIVDVPIGFVVVQAFRQPDDLVDCQMLAEQRLDLSTVQVRVAVWVEQAFFGGDQCALTINVNGATFQHEVGGAVTILALNLQNLLGDLLVAVPGCIQTAVEAAPGVEIPMHTAHVALGIAYERWPSIAYPGIVTAEFYNADVGMLQ